ncbi:MAG: sterol desaturase [Hyphomicrobiales bacterium]|nr:sterol desaturase [Hyphomicrobiales bacterium]
MDVSELLVRNLTTCVSIAAIALLWPWERFAPRVAPGPDWSRRLAAVTVLAAASAFASYFFSEALLGDLLTLYAHVRLFSIAKWDMHPALIFMLSFMIVDLVNYATHLVSHRIGFLWRMHAVHHADEHVAASTSLLHHPLEVLVNAAVGLLVYMVMGIPVIVVTIYALVASLHSVFSHANIRLAPRIERWLRLVLITPDFHRTHHSIETQEGDSNFGAVFPFWDRLFGTYVAHPVQPEDRLVMGLRESEKPAAFAARDLLMHPLSFRKS